MPPACAAEPRRIHTRRCSPSASFWPTGPCSTPAAVTAERRSQRLVPRCLADLAALAREVQTDSKLAERIRRKFAIKNTTGYSLNALVDYQDPFDILQHLMIGSEGTLGFISEITYRTVPDHRHKACALLFFETLVEACRAVTRLKREPVAAVELMDRASLASVTGKPGMPDFLASLGPDATALLVEIQGADGAEVASRVGSVSHALSETPPSRPVEFSTDPYLIEKYWKIRKGLFPAVGAVRPVGTTVIIEDVAVPIESLAAATADLQAALIRHGYAEAIIFGHALDGNLHFVFAQGFADDQAIRRYAALMEEVAEIIVGRYDGSLKAEHGTGRNMAPFVEMEWGKQATDLMWRIKRLFDPHGLLNPGVILNEDRDIHLKNFKPMPATDPLIDRCIECGFCEPMCPTRGLTVTPRQRIVGARELERLVQAGATEARARRFPARLSRFQHRYLRRLRTVRNGLSGRNQHRRDVEGDPRPQPGTARAVGGVRGRPSLWRRDGCGPRRADVCLGVRRGHRRTMAWMPSEP